MGGDIVVGPDHQLVPVERATQLRAQERDIVKLFIHAGNVQYCFEVTSDHTLLIEDLRTPVEAGELAKMDQCKLPRVLTGRGLQLITSVTVTQKQTEVVEVVFADDGVALAWTLPIRRPNRGRARTLSPRAAVACRGAAMEHDELVQELGINKLLMKQLGIDKTHNDTWPLRRSRSVGSRPLRAPWYSIGSLKHSQAEPEKCSICMVHHRHLSNWNADRCKHGEDCRFCHMPHPELAVYRP